MKIKLVKRIKSLFPWFLGLLAMGCVGVNPAGPPAPLAELPSSLNFPDSLQVDTPEVGLAGSSSNIVFKTLNYVKSQVLPIGGEFFDAIVFGFFINEAADGAVSAFLTDLSQFDFPLNPVTRNFEIRGPTLGIFLGQGLKIDFADYDFFGTGTTVGCTGCTCPTGCDEPCPSAAPEEDLQPVCYRIWIDKLGNGEYTRLMAGFFERVRFPDDPNTPEDEENPGVGSFRIVDEDQTVGQILSFAANYNHRNVALPLDKFTEYFISFVLPLGGPPNATTSHVRVEQQAFTDPPSEDHLLKTIQQSVLQEVFVDPNADTTSQYTARFRSDADFWSGSFQNDLAFPDAAFVVPPTIADFTAECAQLSTAIGVDEQTCLDLGIDVTNVPFLDLVPSTDARVNFPADFPLTPTF